MRVIVDTCVWSLALRRNADRNAAAVGVLRELILEHGVDLIGPIRQEILSGVRDERQFERLHGYLSAFADIPLDTDDFVEAARCANRCRAAGIQGSSTDFLICAVALRRHLAVFTTDLDFERYAKVLGLALHRPPE